MKKLSKTFIAAIMTATLIMSLQITAFATVNSINENQGASVQAERVNDMARADEIAPYNETSGVSALHDVAGNTLTQAGDTRNPETGSTNMSIPAIVALLAVSTAAVALTGKNK